MSGGAELETLQRLFADALDDPQRDAQLSAHLRPVVDLQDPLEGSRSSDLAHRDHAAATDAQQAAHHARIGLYRGNVRAARRRALASAYPVLRALTGDPYFDALSLAYARANPSPDADLNRFGAALADFVARYEPDPRHAYFAGVARLEWALHKAAFAADVVPLSPQQWLAMDPAALSDARLAVHPACVALASPFAVDAIWRAHQPGGAWPGRIDTPSWSLVVRPQWRPGVLSQTAAAHAAFVALQNGATLDDALAAGFDLDPGFDFPTQWRAWLGAAAITGLRAD
ncbi:putative DNA-binding domain-containing protein [Paraburkholderia caballeronis]|uniref:HvfC/BufC family peptide modification chaperone n=1 Tax=Paraburkholderia caballeronis TaxID=416943 RepID=UPI0010656C03|nr:putative DNA-binding domain-containing protein [Paraburkholderia caballeronis]TDV18566.1 putative DNA-binding protein [Paraburkholderia caballeronis]TDV19896.1 putative DNA-binding protein [Paraburkholderia caballeronis]TDV28113.1 putative DNA-binding protein [Paraburkholderia caballeronis]